MNHSKNVPAPLHAPAQQGPATAKMNFGAGNARPGLLWRLVDRRLLRRRGYVLIGPARIGKGYWPISLSSPSQILGEPSLRARSRRASKQLVNLEDLSQDQRSDFQDVVSKALIWARRRRILVDRREQEQFLVLEREYACPPKWPSGNALAPVRWLNRNLVNHHDVFADGITYLSAVEVPSSAVSPLRIGVFPRGTHHLLAVVNEPCGYDVSTVLVPAQDWERLSRAVGDVAMNQTVHSITLIIRGDRPANTSQ